MISATESADAPVSLPIVRTLFDRLHAGGVRYCHWKSTRSLRDALAGRTDLDLLVHASDRAGFAEVVTDLGFRPFVSHESRQLPGVEDWLGLEASVPRLVHLHVYHELVLGEELVKNHRLPIEAVLLEHTEEREGIKVPRPEIELAVLAVRALLKYREDAYLRDVLPIGHRGGLPRGITEEVEELLERTSLHRVRLATEEHLAVLPARVIVDFLELAARRPIDAGRMRQLRHELEAALRPYRRRGPLAVAPLRARAFIDRSRVMRTVRHGIERLRGRPSGRRKRPVGGGRTIAVIGIDGAGKSSVIESLVETFSWRMNVATLYLGSSRPGVRTALVQRLTRIVRSAHALARRLGADHVLARGSGAVLAVCFALRAVVEAKEREARVREGARLARDGWVVLFDRYPMPDLAVGERRMDAARVEERPGDPWLVRRLARRERAIYRRIPRADAVLALRVSPEIARGRKPSAPASLEAKAEAIATLGESADGVVVIDADQPLENVLRQATEAVWERL